MRPTRLVTRHDADLEQIGKVIELDPVHTQRLLRSANPSASCEDDYTATTAEDALMRTSLGCVPLLGMSTPLALALVKTSQTMLNLKLES